MIDRSATDVPPGRWLMPAITAAAALAADLLPLTTGPGPLLTLCLVYAWSIRAPELLPAPAVFVLGMSLDAIAGAPLGLTALPLLLVHGLAAAASRPFGSASLALVWALFAPAVLLGAGARWLLASAWWWQPFEVRPALAEAMLTLAAYPLLGLPVAWLATGSRVGQHAARS